MNNKAKILKLILPANIYAVILGCLLLTVGVFAQKFPARPENFVNDYAGMLKPDEAASLNRMLRAYEDSTSNQIVVAIFPNAQGDAVEDFTIRLAEAWKVGQKGRDNGVIMAVFQAERKVRIEVGYGLEDKIPDAIAIQIYRRFVLPRFREGNYYRGIHDGLVALMASASGKYKGLKKKSKRKRRFPLIFLLIWLIPWFLIGRRRRGWTAGSRGLGPFFWGGMGGFGGGFGGGGSFSGGGFSAGGGSFGGGGATGSW